MQRTVVMITRILLGKEGKGSLKAHMIRVTVGTFTIKS